MLQKRKVGFYYLTIEPSAHDVQTVFNTLIAGINDLPKADRKYDLTLDRFCFLDSVNSFQDGTRFELIFKSATHSFSPPLIDSVTIEERDNPKTLQEGERVKTHLGLKLINGDIIIVLEKFQLQILKVHFVL